jgi:hypothetical protein
MQIETYPKIYSVQIASRFVFVEQGTCARDDHHA